MKQNHILELHALNGRIQNFETLVAEKEILIKEVITEFKTERSHF